MKRERPRTTVRPSLRAVVVLALMLVALAPAYAERVGQIRSVDYEEQKIVIDGRTYRLGQKMVPHYAGSNRLADLRRVRTGMPVEYEVDADGTITRLVLLADE